jgi:hypothetical protein
MVLNTMLLVKTQDLVKYLLLQKCKNPEANFSLLWRYYFEDVIGNPDVTDHQNISQFYENA